MSDLELVSSKADNPFGITFTWLGLLGETKSPDKYRPQQNGLLKEIFVGICTQLGPCKADLFATRLNHQLDHYIIHDHLNLGTPIFRLYLVILHNLEIMEASP